MQDAQEKEIILLRFSFIMTYPGKCEIVLARTKNPHSVPSQAMFQMNGKGIECRVEYFGPWSRWTVVRLGTQAVEPSESDLSHNRRWKSDRRQ
jgi:hypothetical protein